MNDRPDPQSHHLSVPEFKTEGRWWIPKNCSKNCRITMFWHLFLGSSHTARWTWRKIESSTFVVAHLNELEWKPIRLTVANGMGWKWICFDVMSRCLHVTTFEWLLSHSIDQFNRELTSFGSSHFWGFFGKNVTDVTIGSHNRTIIEAVFSWKNIIYSIRSLQSTKYRATIDIPSSNGNNRWTTAKHENRQ